MYAAPSTAHFFSVMDLTSLQLISIKQCLKLLRAGYYFSNSLFSFENTIARKFGFLAKALVIAFKGYLARASLRDLISGELFRVVSRTNIKRPMTNS